MYSLFPIERFKSYSSDERKDPERQTRALDDCVLRIWVPQQSMSLDSDADAQSRNPVAGSSREAVTSGLNPLDTVSLHVSEAEEETLAHADDDPTQVDSRHCSSGSFNKKNKRL